MSFPERTRWNLTKQDARWITQWRGIHHDVVEMMMPNATYEDIERLCKETREEGVVHRLKIPLPPIVSAHPDNVMPWARAIFEKEAKNIKLKHWPLLKREIIATTLNPRRIEYLIYTYGFEALEQFE